MVFLIIVSTITVYGGLSTFQNLLVEYCCQICFEKRVVKNLCRVVELKHKISEKRWSTFVDINSNFKKSAASLKRVIFDIIPWGKHTPLKSEISEDNNNQNFTKTVNKVTTGPWSIKCIPSLVIN